MWLLCKSDLRISTAGKYSEFFEIILYLENYKDASTLADKGVLKGLPSLHGGSLEITLSVPLIFLENF